MAPVDIPRLRLNDGREIPQLGFGVFQIPPEDTQRAVEEALSIGYRHVDTAAAYRNERGVGAAIAGSGLPRDDVFVTTKLWNSDQGYESALRACHASLERLGMEYVDLYLIHWPLPRAGRFVETWHALERLRDEGRARSIGVSNFRVEDLERLGRESERRPAVNQVELHPGFQQPRLRRWHERHEVVTEAWGPLAQGAILEEPAVTDVAERSGRTAAQVILRWHLQLGTVAIPKTASPERMRENLDVLDFELGVAEMDALAELDGEVRVGPDPATFALA